MLSEIKRTVKYSFIDNKKVIAVSKVKCKWKKPKDSVLNANLKLFFLDLV